MSRSAIRILDFVFGPTVNRIHKSTDGLNRAYNYYPNDIEEFSEKVLAVAYVFKISVVYSSPLWLIFFYQKGSYNLSWSLGFRFLAWSSFFVGGAFLLRGFGRSSNPEYILFLEILRKCLEDPDNTSNKKSLRRYDFDFEDWPVDYVSEHFELEGNQRRVSMMSFRRNSFETKYDLVVNGFLKESLAYILANTFGLWLMYPGSIGLLKSICASSMRIHRSRLIEEHGGIRAKLCAEDRNMIDTMFIDRRTRESSSPLDTDARVVPNKHGYTLVICCEGNAGFYECGCMSTPMQCGYSVLGWNHPGYMCSTGVPYPIADIHALDVVVEYAIRALHFSPKDIILFAWAFGGFTAIRVASFYPLLKGLVLDATFDDVLCIAKYLLPSYAESLATFAVRNHLNVNNLENLRSYYGPVTFIRREKDEVMNLEGPEVLSSNACNKLLEDFLQTRFPNLFDQDSNVCDEEGCPQEKLLRYWLSLPNEDGRDALLTQWDAHSENCVELLIDEYDQTDGEVFPMQIGADMSSVQKSRLVLFLASKYMHHFSASHCVPLPPSLFIPPWSIELLKNPDPVSSDIESEYEVIRTSSAIIETIKYTCIP